MSSLNQRLINDMQSGSKRRELLRDGAYDGRYRQRIVIDKKKQSKKNWARKTEKLWM